MRTVIVFFGILLLIGCSKSAIEKPNKLISEDTMVDIFYDLALIDAMKAQNPATLENNNIVANEYVYRKYKIDSLQFAQSNRYYASEIQVYKKMYARVGKRLERKKAELDSLHKNGSAKTPVRKSKPKKLPHRQVLPETPMVK